MFQKLLNKQLLLVSEIRMGGDIMTKKARKQRNVSVAVRLTEKQRAIMQEFVTAWDLDMAVIGRRLIQYFIGRKVTLEELLKKYNANYLNKTFKDKVFDSPRTYKFRIHLTRDEKQKLDMLGTEWCCLPGEVARIVVDLFLLGIIGKNDIWE
jgi:hypothetical protein